MRKGLVLWFIALLAACGPSGNAAELEAAIRTTATAVVPAAPAVPTGTTTAPEPTAEDETASDSSQNNNTAVPDYPIATSLAEATQVRDIDWTHGAATPLFTIIEYGDFQ